jgi:ribose transport system substrate-binding protein
VGPDLAGTHLCRWRWLVLTAAAVASVIALAACGSGGDGDDQEITRGSADVAAAQNVLAPYTGKPSAFPVDQPLREKPPAGTTVAYLQCVTPVCGLFGEIIPAAAKTMGVELTIVKAGASADSLQAAADSIIARKPTAVVIPAVEPSTISPQLSKLDASKTPVSANGIMNPERYGIGADQFNNAAALQAGKILAAWVVKTKGDEADAVFYKTPELSFNAFIEQGFKEELSALCHSCKVRSVVVPVSTIGNNAPARVVSDLQSNPKTNVAVFGTLEAAVGLPAAMRTAGLDTTVTGFGPNPSNLQDIESGGITSGLGLDFPVMVWTQLDAAMRLATGQPLTDGEKAGIPPLQMLEGKDITFDPSKGFSGYPDFAQRFGRLWAGPPR